MPRITKLEMILDEPYAALEMPKDGTSGSVYFLSQTELDGIHAAQLETCCTVLRDMICKCQIAPSGPSKHTPECDGFIAQFKANCAE